MFNNPIEDSVPLLGASTLPASVGAAVGAVEGGSTVEGGVVKGGSAVEGVGARSDMPALVVSMGFGPPIKVTAINVESARIITQPALKSASVG